MQVLYPGWIRIWKCWFLWRKETREPKKTPQSKARINNKNPRPESNPGHIGGRRALSPLQKPCSPSTFYWMLKLPRKVEVGCLRHPGASAIGSQLLDGDRSHTKSRQPSHEPSRRRRKPGTHHTDKTVERKEGTGEGRQPLRSPHAQEKH